MSVVDPNMDGEPLSPESTEDNFIPGDLSNLTAYRSSSMLTRFFCTTCSAHMFFRSNVQSDDVNSPQPSWTVMWGVLEKTDGIITIENHIFVGDTLDGGLADHFRSFAGKPLKRLKGWKEENKEELPLGWKAGDGYKNPETLPIYCHCRSVSFNLARASKPSDNPAEYWLVPGKEPTDPIRFITAHCLCNDCRLCSGSQIQTWTIIPNELILDPATKQPVDLVEPSKRPKGLKQYMSSDGKHRESCGTCGATVFWWREMKEGESAHMDVATALIDQTAAGGARAESWISWYNRLIYKDSALSGEIANALEEGVKASTAQA